MNKIISISKDLAKEGELVIIPRREYEILIKKQKSTPEDVLRWTAEAKLLFKKGKLPKLNF